MKWPGAFPGHRVIDIRPEVNPIAHFHGYVFFDTNRSCHHFPLGRLPPLVVLNVNITSSVIIMDVKRNGHCLLGIPSRNFPIP